MWDRDLLGRLSGGGGLLRARALCFGGLVTEAMETRALLREAVLLSLLNLACLCPCPLPVIRGLFGLLKGLSIPDPRWPKS